MEMSKKLSLTVLMFVVLYKTVENVYSVIAYVLKYLTIKNEMPIYFGILIITLSTLVLLYLGVLILKSTRKKVLLYLILGFIASYYLIAQAQLFFAEFLFETSKHSMQKLLKLDIYFSFEDMYFYFLVLTSAITWLLIDKYRQSGGQNDDIIDELNEK